MITGYLLALAVVKWAAMGSGCRAVDFHVAPENEVGKSPLLFELQMSQFNLSSGKRIERDRAVELYSECALRFAIRGQAGMRLRKIESLVKLDVRKEKGSRLLVYNELKFGQFGGEEKRMEYDEHAEIKGRVMDVRLSKELSLLRSDGQTSCGSDQVLFYDFTLFAKKLDHASSVSVSLTAPQKATIRLEFESC